MESEVHLFRVNLSLLDMICGRIGICTDSDYCIGSLQPAQLDLITGEVVAVLGSRNV